MTNLQQAAEELEKAMPDFENRYVLGEGWPVWTPDLPANAIRLIEMVTEDEGLEVDLDFPPELRQRDCPRYRLVLERADLCWSCGHPVGESPGPLCCGKHERVEDSDA